MASSTTAVTIYHLLRSLHYWLAYAVVVNVAVYHMVGSSILADCTWSGVYFRFVQRRSRHIVKRCG